MDLEKCYEQLGPLIKSLDKTSLYSAEDIKDLIKICWEAGYEFRIQEEKLNKGASY